MKNKQILILFILTVVLGLATVFMPVNKSVLKKAEETVQTGIEIHPQSAVLGVGEERPMILQITNPQGKKISFVDIRIGYDKDLVQLSDFQVNTEFFGVGETAQGLMGADSGQARFIAYNTGEELPDSEGFIVGTFLLKTKKVGTAVLTIDKSRSQLVTDDVAAGYILPVLAVKNGSYSISGSASARKVNVKLDPASSTKTINQNFDVDVKIEAGELKIGFMQLALSFDKDKLQIVSFTPNASVFSASGFSANEQVLGNTNGAAKLFAISLGTTFPSGDFTAGKISLRGKVAGIASLTVRKDQTSYFAGLEGDQTKLFNLGTVQDGSYTIGAGGTVPVLNFKVKFQGVNTKRADQKVLVVVVNKNQGKKYDVNVVSDDSGVYSGSVTLSDITPESGFAIFIKGPKHLARKFNENNQVLRYYGLQDDRSITLTKGDNTFDFSKLVLEAGDLPNPNEDMEQDGVANSVDFSLIVDRDSKSDAGSLAVADLNLDGIVNQYDNGLFFITIGTKYEDEY